MATVFDPDPPLHRYTQTPGPNVRFLRNLVMDCEYVLEMKQMEVDMEKNFDPAAATQKIVMTKGNYLFAKNRRTLS